MSDLSITVLFEVCFHYIGYALERVRHYLGCIQSDFVVFKWRTQGTKTMDMQIFLLVL